AVGQGVEQRGLAGVRIAHDGDHGQAAPGPLPTPDRAAGGDGVDLLFQEANAIADPSPVDLELGLAGAAPADAAHEPGQARIALLGQSRQKETRLRQLHLQLAFGALRSLSEDVEDELGTVEDLQRGRLGDVARLGGREVAVEDDQVGAELKCAEGDLLQLALADEVLDVVLATGLQDGIEDLHPRGAGQLLEFAKRGLGGAALVLERHAHEDRLLLAGDGARGDAVRELLLQRPDLPGEIPTDLVDGAAAVDAPQLAIGVLRQKVRELGRAGQAVLPRLDLADEVQAQVRQVGEVVARQALALQVRMHQAQTAETSLATTGAPDLGHPELVGVADDDVLDLPLSGDEHAHLAPDLSRDLGQMAGELRADHLVGAQAPAVGVAKALDLGGLETECISVDVVDDRSSWRAEGVFTPTVGPSPGRFNPLAGGGAAGSRGPSSTIRRNIRSRRMLSRLC